MTKIPAYADIPEHYRNGSSPEADFVSGWFFEGGSAKGLKERPGVDRRAALREIGTILRSFDLPHEHKIAAAAWLLHQSFEFVSNEQRATSHEPELTREVVGGPESSLLDARGSLLRKAP